MQNFKDVLLSRMIETGRLPVGAKIDITSITGENASDYRNVELVAFRKRCRKPFMCWNVCIDIARNLIHWDATKFYYI